MTDDLFWVVFCFISLDFKSKLWNATPHLQEQNHWNFINVFSTIPALQVKIFMPANSIAFSVIADIIIIRMLAEPGNERVYNLE